MGANKDSATPHASRPEHSTPLHHRSLSSGSQDGGGAWGPQRSNADHHSGQPFYDDRDRRDREDDDHRSHYGGRSRSPGHESGGDDGGGLRGEQPKPPLRRTLINGIGAGANPPFYPPARDSRPSAINSLDVPKLHAARVLSPSPPQAPACSDRPV
jgi:hypothetical protein